MVLLCSWSSTARPTHTHTPNSSLRKGATQTLVRVPLGSVWVWWGWTHGGQRGTRCPPRERLEAGGPRTPASPDPHAPEGGQGPAVRRAVHNIIHNITQNKHNITQNKHNITQIKLEISLTKGKISQNYSQRLSPVHVLFFFFVFFFSSFMSLRHLRPLCLKIVTMGS